MEIILQLKDLILMLVGFCALLGTVGGGIYYLMASKFIQTKQFEELCKAHRDECHLAVCKKIDKISEHVEQMQRDNYNLRLWLIPIITLMAQKDGVPVVRMQM